MVWRDYEDKVFRGGGSELSAGFEMFPGVCGNGKDMRIEREGSWLALTWTVRMVTTNRKME